MTSSNKTQMTLFKKMLIVKCNKLIMQLLNDINSVKPVFKFSISKQKRTNYGKYQNIKSSDMSSSYLVYLRLTKKLGIN